MILLSFRWEHMRNTFAIIIAITEKNDNVFYMFSRNNKICFWDFLPKGIETLEFLIHGKYSTADCIWQEKAFFRF